MKSHYGVGDYQQCLSIYVSSEREPSSIGGSKPSLYSETLSQMPRHPPGSPRSETEVRRRCGETLNLLTFPDLAQAQIGELLFRSLHARPRPDHNNSGQLEQRQRSDAPSRPEVSTLTKS